MISFEPRIVDIPCKDCGKVTRHIEDWYPPEMMTVHYMARCYDCQFKKDKKDYEDFILEQRKSKIQTTIAIVVVVLLIIAYGILFR